MHCPVTCTEILWNSSVNLEWNLFYTVIMEPGFLQKLLPQTGLYQNMLRVFCFFFLVTYDSALCNLSAVES